MQTPAFDPGLTQKFTAPVSRVIKKDGSFNVRRRGGNWHDINPYLHLVNMSWPAFLLTVFVGYLAVNLVFALAAAVTIVWVVEGCPGFRPAGWVLASPPVAYLGRISYALYLWHILVLEFLRRANGGYVWTEPWIAPLAIAGSIGMATVSYFLIERRFLRVKWRLSETGSHDADVTVVVGRHEPELTLQPETS